MSMADILDVEIERRRLANVDLIAAQVDIIATIEQFNKLDEVHRTNEKMVRERLTSVYKENRHFTGKQPVIYTFAQTEKYPFYGGNLDTQCNPYFPITKVQDKTFDGIAPLYAPPTKTGAFARDANFSPIESTFRNPAIAGITAFPDISGETGMGSCAGETPGGSGVDETTCLANGGVWTPPGYAPGATATEKLRAVLDPWRADVVIIIADLWANPGGTELTYWNDILSKIDDILAAIQVDVVYPFQTQDFTPSSPEDLARDYFIANASAINTHITNRSAFLTKQANADEELFFGVIKLRLHQANGSYAKLQAAKNQKNTNKSIVDDNIAAIRSLNLLKVKSS
jgi:hypothetical protein